ncbi:MAG: hypothetical protein WCX31_07360 [Salinivirgaceae bacterium]|jgi:uncharacterized coiled-coil DUF342 family protein
MAKIRDLKNEVNYLTYEIISDCNAFIALRSDKKNQAVVLVEEAVALRNKLIEKINHPNQPSPNYYKQIRNELINGADHIFEKLRKLIK